MSYIEQLSNELLNFFFSLFKMPKPLVIHYGSLVSANPKNRTNPRDFLQNAKKSGQFLNNPFITANIFLQEIQVITF